MTLACPGGQPDQSTGVTDSQLAVLLRQAQWALDDARPLCLPCAVGAVADVPGPAC